jgi:hypothetical protein
MAHKEFRGPGKGKGPIVGYNHKKWNENFGEINWHNQWCAFCGLWTNHTSGSCPELKGKQNESTPITTNTPTKS